MQRMRTGFTLIELMITMVIMVILIGLSVILIGNIQAQARDSERAQDVESIARGLEIRYKQSYSYKNAWGDTITQRAGVYPGDIEMWEWAYYKVIPNDKIFPGVSEKTLTSPSGERLGYVCALAGYNQPACDKTEKATNIEGVFSNGSGGWKDVYIYEEIGINDNYCNNNGDNADACVRFKLYWISETDKTVNPKYPNIPGLKIIESKHQQ